MANKRNIEDVYTLGQVLGTGTSSVVVIGTHKATNAQVAVKIVDKTKMTQRQVERVYSEIDVLNKVNHPNIVNLLEHFETNTKIYLVMELKTGGELFDRILDKGYFTEDEAWYVMRQIGAAVHYLHSRGIVHRDLKPENLIFETKDDNSPICLADFGFAKFAKDEENLTTPCGTPGYVAPEIANSESYKKSVDMWSLGVIMYTLLCGFPPFYSDDDDVLLELIVEGEFSFPDPYWTGISTDAKDLVTKLLEKNPAKRYTAEQFLNHRWIGGKMKKDSEYRKSVELANDQISNIKHSLNKSIDLTREATYLRAASESTVWKRRQNNKDPNNKDNKEKK